MVVGGGNERLFGPGEEPIYGGAVDQSGEGPQSPSEVFSDGRHADDHMEVVLAERDKVLVLFVE